MSAEEIADALRRGRPPSHILPMLTAFNQAQKVGDCQGEVSVFIQALRTCHDNLVVPLLHAVRLMARCPQNRLVSSDQVSVLVSLLGFGKEVRDESAACVLNMSHDPTTAVQFVENGAVEALLEGNQSALTLGALQGLLFLDSGKLRLLEGSGVNQLIRSLPVLPAIAPKQSRAIDQSFSDETLILMARLCGCLHNASTLDASLSPMMKNGIVQRIVGVIANVKSMDVLAPAIGLIQNLARFEEARQLLMSMEAQLRVADVLGDNATIPVQAACVGALLNLCGPNDTLKRTLKMLLLLMNVRDVIQDII